MAQTQYDCIVCGAHFESSQDLSKHNREQHLKQATGTERPRESGNGSDESIRPNMPPED